MSLWRSCCILFLHLFYPVVRLEKKQTNNSLSTCQKTVSGYSGKKEFWLVSPTLSTRNKTLPSPEITCILQLPALSRVVEQVQTFQNPPVHFLYSITLVESAIGAWHQRCRPKVSTDTPFGLSWTDFSLINSKNCFSLYLESVPFRCYVRAVTVISVAQADSWISFAIKIERAFVSTIWPKQK